jgi:hypothetical protein
MPLADDDAIGTSAFSGKLLTTSAQVLTSVVALPQSRPEQASKAEKAKSKGLGAAIASMFRSKGKEKEKAEVSSAKGAVTSSVTSSKVEVRKDTAPTSARDKKFGTEAIDAKFSEKPIAEQQKAHSAAKAFLQEQGRGVGTSVEFVRPPKMVCPKLADVTIKKDLDGAVFSFQHTNGVQGDILAAGKRQGNQEVIFVAASQFNAGEAPGAYTVKPGEACSTYKGDITQGPQAQLSFSDDQVELLNCGANRGFNGLSGILDENTKTAAKNGYFTPTGPQSDAVIDQLRTKGDQIEYACTTSRPKDGSKNVHMMLCATPAFGQYRGQGNAITQEQQHEVEFLCALHSYRAQFSQSIEIAKSTGNPVLLNAYGVGLGVFGNDPGVVAKAFYLTAKEAEAALKENKVSVQFQIFKKSEASAADLKSIQLASALGLKQK